MAGWHFFDFGFIDYNFGRFFGVQGQVVGFGPAGNGLQLRLNSTGFGGRHD